MIEIRRLDCKDHEKVYCLIRTVEAGLECPDWFIPFPEVVLQNMFKEASVLTVYGVFVDNQLAGISMLDRDQHEILDLVEAMNILRDIPTAELSYMVLPQFRGRNLISAVNARVLQDAAKNGVRCVVASVHDDNTASIRILENMGMTRQAHLLRHGSYKRRGYCIYI